MYVLNLSNIFLTTVRNCRCVRYSSGDKIEKNEMGGTCSTYGGGKAYKGFRWGNLRVRDHLGDRGLDGRIILRWVFRKWDLGVWTRSSWFWIRTVGGHLCMW
jgi:hypothetical protein